jgi:hypothetical protein
MNLKGKLVGRGIGLNKRDSESKIIVYAFVEML